MNDVRRTATVFLVAALLAAPALAAADDDPPGVVVVNGDDHLTISLDGTELSLIAEEAGETSVHMVDLALMGDLVGESLAGLDDVLAELQDLQIDVHVGADNNFRFSHDDATWELDMDEIMSQLSVALESGLGTIETEDWTNVRVRDRTTEELRTELRELRAELRELRRQLDDQRDDD